VADGDCAIRKRKQKLWRSGLKDAKGIREELGCFHDNAAVIWFILQRDTVLCTFQQ
jgi:hypothetical protein